MSEAEQKMPPSGTITWTEIPVMNMTRAQEFYKSAFDWTLKPMPAVCPKTGKTLDEPNVVLFGVGSVEAGNFRKVAEADHLSPASDGSKSKAAVRVTIAVTSIDETVKLIEKAGEEIYIPKAEIPGNMGFIAFFLDTEKNVMGIWSNKG